MDTPAPPPSSPPRTAPPRPVPSSPPPAASSDSAATSGVDVAAYERLLRDYKRLKSRLDTTEKENEALRASLWEVSWRVTSAGPEPPARAPRTSPADNAETTPKAAAQPDVGRMTPLALPAAGQQLGLGSSAARDFDLELDLPAEKAETWKWGRGPELRGHRGAVYDVKFAAAPAPGRGHLLASGGFDGVRLWGPASGAYDTLSDDDPDPWDAGIVSEIAHIAAHRAPVSTLAWASDGVRLLSGGYDSTLHVYAADAHAPSFSQSTDRMGPVQTVAWIPASWGRGYEGGACFAWGTSGRWLGVSDTRTPEPVLRYECDAMVNAIVPFDESPLLLVGDSYGRLRHFSVVDRAFSTNERAKRAGESGGARQTGPGSPGHATHSTSHAEGNLDAKRSPKTDTTKHSPSASSDAPPKRSPIAALATSPATSRWLAASHFDNTLSFYDRTQDPTRSLPRTLQTLKGRNRNWPVKVAFYQGSRFFDSKYKQTTSRSRSPTQFQSSQSEEEALTPSDVLLNNGAKKGVKSMPQTRSNSAMGRPRQLHISASNYSLSSLDSTSDGSVSTTPSSQRKPRHGMNDRHRPFKDSLLLASGSSDRAVLIFDLSAKAKTAQQSLSDDDLRQSSKKEHTVESNIGPIQRLEGHKDVVYAVDFLQRDSRSDAHFDHERYLGMGLLASSGADSVVKLWKPVYYE